MKFIKRLKYLFGPCKIDKHKTLFLRKRLLHKGYSLLTVSSVGNYYLEIKDFESFDKASSFILSMYNINIETN